MKKFIVWACIFITSSSNFFSQESRREMNKEYGEKYKDIDTESSLSSYEKGQKKRALALKQKKDNINYNQENYYSDHRDKKKKNIEKKIVRLEERYKKDKEKIEKNNNLSKKEKRIKKKILKKEFKLKKEVLKK